MDLTKLSDADLEAIAARDMARVSDAGLKAITGDTESESFKEGRKSSLRGLYSVLQGPTFGFADEIGGAVVGGAKALFGDGSFKDNYRNTRDFMRGAAKREEEDSPWITTITRLMAGAPTMAAFPAGPAAGLSTLANTGRAAAVGGITGAVSGAGQSTAEDFGGVGLDALKGGAVGATMSGAMVPVARGMGKSWEAAAGRFNESAAGRYAKEKLAEALQRDARGSVVQQNPQAVLDQVNARLLKLGPEARVVDAAGQNTRQLLDTLATLPGKTKDATEAAILSRQSGRADRLQGALQSSLNPSGVRAQTAIDELVQQRSEAAAPIYGELYKRGVWINDELRGLIDAANKLGAGAKGKEIATAKQTDYSLNGDAKWAPMRELDYLKQGLDDIIAANKNELTGSLNKVGAAVQGLKSDLVSLLDQETKGLYKQAREAFAGPSALIDAATAGRKVWSQGDDIIGKTLSGMTQSEAEAFKLGAAEALRAKLGNQSGQTEVMKMWRDKSTRDKLQAIFGDERGFREFASKVAAESRMKGLESVGRGSQTAARLYGGGDLDAPAVADVVRTAASPTLQSILATAGNVWNKVKTPEPVRDKMGELLLSRGPAGMQTVQELEDALRRVAQERQLRSGLLGVSGGQLAPVGTGLLMGR